MIRTTDVVFDDIVEDRDPSASMHIVTTYTSLEHTDFLASASQLVFQVLIDVLTTRDDVPFSVTVEHSADGQNWKTKNASPEVSGTIPRSVGAISFSGGERWPALPSQKFARLCISVGGPIGPFALQVVIHAGNRSRVIKEQPAPVESPLPGDATLFGVRREVVTEIETLMDAAAELPHEDRYEYLSRKLSSEALAEVNSLQLRLRSLEPGTRRALFHAAAATVGILTMPPLWRKPITSPEAAPCADCPPPDSARSDARTCEGACEPVLEHRDDGERRATAPSRAAREEEPAALDLAFQGMPEHERPSARRPPVVHGIVLPSVDLAGTTLAGVGEDLLAPSESREPSQDSSELERDYK